MVERAVESQLSGNEFFPQLKLELIESTLK